MSVNKRIEKLRSEMEKKGIAAYIVNTSDPHMSEYLADHYKTRVYISGFTGSAGTAVVTKNRAILWTDGRYFIQAEAEIARSEFELFKMATEGYPSYTEWLKDNLKDGDTLGFDGKTYSQSDFEILEKEFKNKDIKIEDEFDLIGKVWGDRPELPKAKAFIHELKYTGKTIKEKLCDIREKMKEKNADYFVLGSLDDIAWTFNIRGRDVLYTPVIISYALISIDKSYLFVDLDKINADTEKFLNENEVAVNDYNDVEDFLNNIEDSSKVFLDKSMTNRYIFNSIPKSAEIISDTNISTNLKGNKNEVEIKNQKNAYIKDGVALTKFLYWLDNNIGKEEISEISAADKLLEFRKEQKNFIEPSFSTISAYGANAAMAHYSADEDSNKVLEQKGFYLVDSGGQYLDGTTDITRTIVLGDISDEEKRDFTLTLKGHINLSNAKFLSGTNGYQLDILCRAPMWQEGLDFKHGTGHGVGYLLGVHEGPHRIANSPNNISLEKGMIVSIEPGVYKVGKHGIRIENIVVVEDDIKTESGQFMKFSTLSYTPIDLRAIDLDILDQEEKDWLNDYHKEVYDKIAPYLDKEEKKWLKHNTKSI